jgi:hypothetical protein
MPVFVGISHVIVKVAFVAANNVAIAYVTVADTV